MDQGVVRVNHFGPGTTQLGCEHSRGFEAEAVTFFQGASFDSRLP
jgi:hypothetical protein